MTEETKEEILEYGKKYNFNYGRNMSGTGVYMGKTESRVIVARSSRGVVAYAFKSFGLIDGDDLEIIALSPQIKDLADKALRARGL